MIRYYCDLCGMEVTEEEYNELKRFDINKSWWKKVYLCDDCCDRLKKWLEDQRSVNDQN